MSFIDEIAPHAQEIGIDNDILPSLIIGQAILESASGKSELAQKGNNLFGIKGSYNGESVTILTTEFVNGEKIKVNAAFCKYPSWRESIEALANKYVMVCHGIGIYIEQSSVKKTIGKLFNL